MLLEALTLAKCKTSEKGCLNVASLLHLLLISLPPKQLKLINNPLLLN